MSDWRKLDWLPSYEISSDGEVRRAVGGQGSQAGKVLRADYSTGYARLNLFEGGQRLLVKAHRLVCEAFNGPPPFPGAQVAHWDGDKTNNHYANLRWATAFDNAADKTRHGTQAAGEKHPAARLTWDAVRTIRATYKGRFGEIARIAREYGLARSSVSNIVNHKSWREADEFDRETIALMNRKPAKVSA